MMDCYNECKVVNGTLQLEYKYIYNGFDFFVSIG